VTEAMLSAQADTNFDLSDGIFQREQRSEIERTERTANKQQSDHENAHKERR
jgi:hypothetical protein